MRQLAGLIRFRSPHALRAIVVPVTILAWCLSLGVAAQAPTGMSGPPAMAAPSANVSVFATGLLYPRGMRFGADGSLYVAEAGTGGMTSTVGQCPQTPDPVGPYTGGKTARISKISSTGMRTTVADNLPSTRDAMGFMSSTTGVSDVEFVNGTLYALLEGGGCSHGNPDVANGVIKVNADGTWTRVADLSAWAHANLTKMPSMDDFEPDGNYFSMTQANGALYVLDPNHGELIKVTLDGQVSRVVDFSGEPWIGPTTVVSHGGAFYISNLGEFPITANDARVYKVTPDGTMSVVATGLKAVLGLAYDSQGRLYALEMSTAENMGPVPGTGAVLRQTASGWETVASGLMFPTAMTFGPDGMLYVANVGFGPPMASQIVRVNVNAPAGMSAAPSASIATAPASTPVPTPASAATGATPVTPSPSATTAVISVPAVAPTMTSATATPQRPPFIPHKLGEG